MKHTETIEIHVDVNEKETILNAIYMCFYINSTLLDNEEGIAILNNEGETIDIFTEIPCYSGYKLADIIKDMDSKCPNGCHYHHSVSYEPK